MKLLLDTCTALWLALDQSELSPAARKAFLNEDNEVILSSVSSWEMAVKYSMGRLTLPDPPERFIPDLRTQLGVTSLPLCDEDTYHLPKLPHLHKDPFDRMLICQAINHGAAILTPDPAIHKYPVRTLW